jgi:MFS family permease
MASRHLPFTNRPYSIMAWVSNNSPSQSQRATGLGLLNSVGQCLSILAAFIFPSKEGPRWHKGFGVNLAFNILAIIIALGLTAWFRWENKRRDRVEGGKPAEGTRHNFQDQYDLSPGTSISWCGSMKLLTWGCRLPIYALSRKTMNRLPAPGSWLSKGPNSKFQLTR